VNASIYDRFTRHAAAMPRRRSLLSLGGAVVSAAVGSPARAAGRKAGKQARKRCKKQQEECRGFFTERCQGNELCEQAFIPCCEDFARCDAGAAMECIYTVV
jgi:hypothetical protein